MATERAMTEPAIKRNVCFVLLGVVALALKAPYSGPLADAVQCWGGNVSASFAVYFVIAGSILGRRLGRLAAATIALLAVQLFEVTNGFGLMTNVYDPADLAANLAGVGVAWATDFAAGRFFVRGSDRTALTRAEIPMGKTEPPPIDNPRTQPDHSGMP